MSTRRPKPNWPKLSHLAEVLWTKRVLAVPEEPVMVRLQVYTGDRGWAVRTGPVYADPDTYGHWGAGFIEHDAPMMRVKALARTLLAQAKDHFKEAAAGGQEDR